MIRWYDPSVSMWVKLGDLDIHFGILMQGFPFERLLLDAKQKPKEVKKFMSYCLRNFGMLSIKQKTMVILITDFTLMGENDLEMAGLIQRVYGK